jgi:hypothetical protein
MTMIRTMMHQDPALKFQYQSERGHPTEPVLRSMDKRGDGGQNRHVGRNSYFSLDETYHQPGGRRR